MDFSFLVSFYRWKVMAMLNFSILTKDQDERESNRIRGFRTAIEKFAEQIDKQDAAKILQEMEICHINVIIDLSDEQKKAFDLDWDRIIQESKIEVGTHSSDSLKHYQDWIMKMLEHLYDVEQHCDRFTSYMDNMMEEFENKVEAKIM